MNSNSKKTLLILTILIITLLGVFFFKPNFTEGLTLYIKEAKSLTAGIFFIDSITEEELKQDYALAEKTEEKIKVLIVSGHDDSFWGTEFGGEVKELDLNIELSEKLYNLFKEDDKIEAFITHDKNTGTYSEKFLSYFDKEENNIKNFRASHKGIMDDLISSGLIKDEEWIIHNKAPSKTATRLYGINKWANENNIDIVIHVHFNDYPGRGWNKPGEYTGFSIYIPEKQFSNAKASKALGEKVFKQLNKYFPVSDLPKENIGLIEDQSLIAIGSYNTLDAAVMLIEYGYIYEARFINPKVRPKTLNEMAMQTYVGIKNFFEENAYNGHVPTQEKLANLPYKWENNLKNGIINNEDVLALQTALLVEGLYPPRDKTKNQCPINGNFGPCTQESVKNFQETHEIKPIMGIVGPLTREKLNELYAK